MRCEGHSCSAQAAYKCAGCRSAVYCSKRCQVAAFPKHANECVISAPRTRAAAAAEAEAVHKAFVFDVDGTLTKFPGVSFNSLFVVYTAAVHSKMDAIFKNYYALQGLIKDLKEKDIDLFGVNWGGALVGDEKVKFDENFVQSLARVVVMANSRDSRWTEDHPLSVFLLSEDPFGWGKAAVENWVDTKFLTDEIETMRKWLESKHREHGGLFSVVSNSWRASISYMLGRLGVAHLFNLSWNANKKERALGSAFRSFARMITGEYQADVVRIPTKPDHWMDGFSAEMRPRSESGAPLWRMLPNGFRFVPLIEQAKSLGITSVFYLDDSNRDIGEMTKLARMTDHHYVESIEGEKNPPRFDLVKLFEIQAGQQTLWLGSQGVPETLDKVLAEDEPKYSRVIKLADTRLENTSDFSMENVSEGVGRPFWSAGEIRRLKELGQEE